MLCARCTSACVFFSGMTGDRVLCLFPDNSTNFVRVELSGKSIHVVLVLCFWLLILIFCSLRRNLYTYAPPGLYHPSPDIFFSKQVSLVSSDMGLWCCLSWSALLVAGRLISSLFGGEGWPVISHRFDVYGPVICHSFNVSGHPTWYCTTFVGSCEYSTVYCGLDGTFKQTRQYF